MKKLLAAVFLSSLSFAGVCDEVKLSDHVPVPPHTVESVREIFGLCEMILNINGQLIPVYATKDFIISGEMFSFKRQITKEKMDDVRARSIKKVLSKIGSIKYVSYKPEGAKKDRYFYFISDPDCPFCNRVKARVKELADKYRYEIRLIWFPLPFHREAKPKAVSFLCENRTYEDYLRDSYGSKACEEGEKEVEKSLRILRDYVRGTPTFIFPDGEVVVGADTKRLEEVMKR
jgi:thiol:disulfide interchange protein DsbC